MQYAWRTSRPIIERAQGQNALQLWSSFGAAIGLEEIMTRSARIGLAAILLLRGVTFAMAQYGPYPPGARNPNPYGYYGYNEYSGYYARPRYAPYYYGTRHYVLGYPVPHYGYMGWRGWR